MGSVVSSSQSRGTQEARGSSQPGLADWEIDAPEAFREIGGVVVREVHRRSAGAPSHVSVMGTPAVDHPGMELAAIADLSFLKAKAPLEAPSGGSSLRCVDLFSGCGAMSLGMAEACRALGIYFVPVLACDHDRSALRVYSANFRIPVPDPIDLAGLSSIVDGSSTPLEMKLRRHIFDIDIVIAGPPCQGHSNLNNHTRRQDPKNALYFKVARFARLFEPGCILIENVPAVVRDRANVVPRTMAALMKLGYRVEIGVVDLTRIGVPQTRKRHILIAGKGQYWERVPTVVELTERYRCPVRSVGWAIDDLAGGDMSSSFDRASSMTSVTKRRINFLFDNDLDDLPDVERPDCHRMKRHSYPSVYGRMKWDAPAPTITGGFDTMGRGRFVHPLHRRTITPHEAARLQFVPDFFRFDGIPTRKALAELIGNAVPPKLSYVVGLEMFR